MCLPFVLPGPQSLFLASSQHKLLLHFLVSKKLPTDIPWNRFVHIHPKMHWTVFDRGRLETTLKNKSSPDHFFRWSINWQTFTCSSFKSVFRTLVAADSHTCEGGGWIWCFPFLGVFPYDYGQSNTPRAYVSSARHLMLGLHFLKQIALATSAQGLRSPKLVLTLMQIRQSMSFRETF